MNKSLVAPIRYFSVSLCAMMLSASVIASNTYTLSQEDKALIESSQAIIDEAQAMAEEKRKEFHQPNNPIMMQAQEEAKSFFDRIKGSDPTLKKLEQMKQGQNPFLSHRIVVFASRSLGEQGMQSLFEMASLNQDVLVVFRGIPEDANLGDAMLEIQAIAKQFEPIPNIAINPLLFTEYGVESVPTIIVRDAQSSLPGVLPKEIARVAGLSNPDWLLRRVDEGELGDSGVRGPVESISEPDMIELMKQRYAAIDWQEQKEKAVERFWEKQTFSELPEAHKDRVRELDPSIYIAEDILTNDGQVIAKKGDVINPLHVQAFTQVLVVFDPVDIDQVDRVEARVKEIQAEKNISRVTYIATRLDKKDGWKSFEEITNRLDSHVFLLTPDVKQRFELQYVPSVVTANSDHFIVEELADREEQGEKK